MGELKHLGAMDEQPVSIEELAEYRRIRPQLIKMLAEWDLVRGKTGCPVFRELVAPTPPA